MSNLEETKKSAQNVMNAVKKFNGAVECARKAHVSVSFVIPSSPGFGLYVRTVVESAGITQWNPDDVQVSCEAVKTCAVNASEAMREFYRDYHGHIKCEITAWQSLQISCTVLV